MNTAEVLEYPADAARASRRAVFSWIAEGRLREGVHYVYIGRLLRFPYPAALEAFVADAQRKAEAPTVPEPTPMSPDRPRVVRKPATGCPINPAWMQ